MAGTWKWYGNGLLSAMKGEIDFDTDTFKLCLTTQVPSTTNQDNDIFRSSITEVGASGTYAAGGATLAGVTVTYDGPTNEVRISWSPDPSFTGATITAQTAVIYKSTGAAGTDRLVAFCSEAAPVSSTAGTFLVDLPSPVLKITAAA